MICFPFSFNIIIVLVHSMNKSLLISYAFQFIIIMGKRIYMFFFSIPHMLFLFSFSFFPKIILFFSFFCFYVFLNYLCRFYFFTIKLVENSALQFFSLKYCRLLQCFSKQFLLCYSIFSTCFFSKIIFVEFIFLILRWLRIQFCRFFSLNILDCYSVSPHGFCVFFMIFSEIIFVDFFFILSWLRITILVFLTKHCELLQYFSTWIFFSSFFMIFFKTVFVTSIFLILS